MLVSNLIHGQLLDQGHRLDCAYSPLPQYQELKCRFSQYASYQYYNISDMQECGDQQFLTTPKSIISWLIKLKSQTSKQYMLTQVDKFVCIYNCHDLKHDILKIQLLAQQIALPKSFFKGNISGCLNQATINQKDEEQQENVLQIVNFKTIFDRLGINIQFCSSIQLFVAELNRYCHLHEILGLNNKQIKLFIDQCNSTNKQSCQNKQGYLGGINQIKIYSIKQKLRHLCSCVPSKYADLSVLLLRYSFGDFQKLFSSTFLQFNTQNQINVSPQAGKNVSFWFKSNGLSQHGFKPYFMNSNQESIAIEDVKQRDRSRTIGEIRKFVHKWRYLAEQGINGQKLNLQEAAQYVGIPKKSLDDYFYQLRAGQKFQFDFQIHSDKNISFLRRFVKNKIPNRNREKLIELNDNSNRKTQCKNQIKQNFNELSQNNLQDKNNNRLPKKLKNFEKQTCYKNLPQKDSINKNIAINQQENCRKNSLDSNENYGQQINLSKIYKLSDSQVSSISIWPKFNNQFKDQIDDNAKNIQIFDEEDSFFNDFKFGYPNFVKFDHLMKNETNQANSHQSQNGNQMFGNGLGDGDSVPI